MHLIEDLAVSGTTLVEVYTDRIKLSVRRKFVAIGLGAAAGLCAAFALASASLAVLRGLCGAFTALCGGRAWAGDLLGGLVALSVLGGGAALALSIASRRDLRRLEKKYEQIRSHRERKEASAENH